LLSCVPGMSEALLARDTAAYVLSVVQVLRKDHLDVCTPSSDLGEEPNDSNPEIVDPEVVADAISQGYWKDPFYVVSTNQIALLIVH
jgi:hypothetical protein